MATIKGGQKLVLYLEKLAAQLRQPAVLRVGFLENAKYPKGTPVAMVAAIQDFGTKKIPSRPFFRNMIAAKKSEWGPALELALKRNKMDVKKSMQQLGEGIAGQLRQSIRDTNEPPLSPVTIARKGFEKPLVDTGHMLASVDYEIKIP